MTRLTWDDPKTHIIRLGVDHGVVYPRGVKPISWNGLLSVIEQPSDGDQKFAYYDGQHYVQNSGVESFNAVVEAVTYPDIIDQESIFDLSYRIFYGNAYELHLIYNAQIVSSEQNRSTMSSIAAPTTFKWDLSTRPETGLMERAGAHVVINSLDTVPEIMTVIENLIYGTTSNDPRLPRLPELMAIFEALATLQVIDNGDGTWTATGPTGWVDLIDSTTFQITSPSAAYISADTYTLSSW